MSDIDYGLNNIDNQDIETFQRFLGYGDPFSNDIWIIGNEECYGYLEGFNDKISNYELEYSDSDLLQRELYDGYFTKKFSKIHGNGCCWEGYRIMSEKYDADLNKLFISEFFFLPSKDGKTLENEYGGQKLPEYEEIDEKGKIKKYKTRKDFYKINKLHNLLKDRIEFIYKLFTEANPKKIIFHGTSQYKRDLIEKYFKKDMDFIEIIPFITDGYKKCDSLKLDKYLQNGWIKSNDKCEECCGLLIEKTNNDFHNTFNQKCLECSYEI